MATQTQRVGVVGHSQFYAGADIGNQNAGFHNSLYRGKKLGTSVSAEQYAQISAGTFDDMFIGDYWEINSVIWRIAAFDYWLHSGDTNFNIGIDKTQLPLFQHEPSRICNRASWWLRSVVSATYFARVFTSGLASAGGASDSLGIRPAFAIRA